MFSSFNSINTKFDHLTAVLVAEIIDFSFITYDIIGREIQIFGRRSTSFGSQQENSKT
jgi:hypothetical protein